MRAGIVADKTDNLWISDKAYFSKLLPSLSQSARKLWGKITNENRDLWLPLYVHLSDMAAVADVLWDHWVPVSTKGIIARGIQKADSTLDTKSAFQSAKKLFLSCAVVHDIGKATPAFQVKAKHANPDLLGYLRGAGLVFHNMSSPEKIPHALASQAIAERHHWSRSISIILGGHHGKPPSANKLGEIDSYSRNTGFAEESWVSVQDELFSYALQLISVSEDNILFQLNIDKTAQIVLTGLLIMADWLASDSSRFQYLPVAVVPGTLESPVQRAHGSWDELGWTKPWLVEEKSLQPGFFESQFGFTPRPSQESVASSLIDSNDPGLVIIEAPMGDGKTEAALVAAEIMAAKTGSGGLFLALPTQATSDGMFPRVIAWMETLEQFSGDKNLNNNSNHSVHSVYLAHGKSQFNEEYLTLQRYAHPQQVGIDSDINEQRAAAIVNDWFRGRKRGILADFVVGTIDQVLMAGLMQRHLALRHLALTNKVVIIDECHAYDAYMSSYLYKVMSWLGTYRVPTIVLSATLPGNKRKQLIDSYLGKDSSPKVAAIPHLGITGTDAKQPSWAKTQAYPLITYTEGEEIVQIEPERSARSLSVKLQRLDECRLLAELESLLVDGGCVGIIVNTVARAQGIAVQCKERFGSDIVELHHSQFLAPDRIKKEAELRKYLGPSAQSLTRPATLIVVGTQVLEQSLDIDFDVLITDICPMDLLIQRIGRLHRHADRERPAALKAARCYVTGITDDGSYESGSVAIYGRYLLMNTDILLPDILSVPDDISRLVQRAYSDEGLEELSKDPLDYRAAKEEFDQHIDGQKARAELFQIAAPQSGSKTLVGWLDSSVKDDASGRRGEATVRDTGDSLNVLLIQQHANGQICLLPWVDQQGDSVIPQDTTPSYETAKAMARCTVKLPSRFCMPWNIDRTISELEQNNIDALPSCWQYSEWLEGELFLILDEGYQAELGGHILHYSRDNGLSIKRSGDER